MTLLMTWKRPGKISSWVNEEGHRGKVKLEHVVIQHRCHSNHLEWFKLNLKRNQKCQFHQNHHIHQIWPNQDGHGHEDLVRFVISDDEDEINIPVDQKQTEKPSKEAAREFLTGKLPSTIRVNVDHDPQSGTQSPEVIKIKVQ